jgi:hypothetical protein
MISHLPFMGEMCADHEIAIMPNACDGLSDVCPGMDVDVFTEGAARTNFDPDFAAAMLKILRRIAHGDERVELAIRANVYAARQANMADQLNIIA